jgi:hypothetical protein
MNSFVQETCPGVDLALGQPILYPLADILVYMARPSVDDRTAVTCWNQNWYTNDLQSDGECFFYNYVRNPNEHKGKSLPKRSQILTVDAQRSKRHFVAQLDASVL